MTKIVELGVRSVLSCTQEGTCGKLSASHCAYFIKGAFSQVCVCSKRLTVYRVLHYLQFQVPTGGLGKHPLQGRGTV
jgi:hypothetical protein